MVFETLESGIENIGKWNYWKTVLETLESGIMGKWYRKHWKMILESLENGSRNIGKSSYS